MDSLQAVLFVAFGDSSTLSSCWAFLPHLFCSDLDSLAQNSRRARIVPRRRCSHAVMAARDGYIILLGQRGLRTSNGQKPSDTIEAVRPFVNEHCLFPTPTLFFLQAGHQSTKRALQLWSLCFFFLEPLGTIWKKNSQKNSTLVKGKSNLF